MFLLDLIALVSVVFTLGALIQQQQQNNTILMTIAERLTAIETKLDEAASEITTELITLRGQLGNVITPEAEATLARLEGKATALANIIPGSPSPTPAAEPTQPA